MDPAPTAIGGLEAVFFDLDGTLIDTAPDMVAVLSRMVQRYGQRAVPYDVVRNNVSNGAIGLLRLGFPDAKEDQMKDLHAEYLDDYEQSVCVASTIFSPLQDLLDLLDDLDLCWGIVTNKPERMTLPLLRKLGIGDTAACIVCGDTLAERKPHPAPLLHAAQLAGVQPTRAVYIGDAARDIEAGRAAGMVTIAVAYGYITKEDSPDNWGADAVAADTMSLIEMIRKAIGVKS